MASAARDQRAEIAPSPRFATHRPPAPDSTDAAVASVESSQPPLLQCLPDCTCPSEQYECLAIRDRAAPAVEGGASEQQQKDFDMFAATSKHAEQTVMPFLTEHIPMQYNMVGLSPEHQQNHVEENHQERTNTKYCYRHRPDLKCRRQADAPSMALLQKELATLSHSDQQAISHVWSLFSAAPGKHRELMLQGILAQCCFPQLSYISGSVRELIKVDFLDALPAELGFKILCCLDTTSLCKAAQVSRRWRILADDDVVWHKMCEQHIDRKCTKCGWGLPLLERKRLRIEKRQIQLRASGKGMNPPPPPVRPVLDETNTAPGPSLEMMRSSTPSGTKRSMDDASLSESVKKQRSLSAQDDALLPIEAELMPPQRRPWKDVYKDRFRVGTNWKHGRFTTKVFKGHTNGVMCVQFDDKVLISGSYDSTAKVWDVNTGELLRTLKGHTKGIRCLQFDDTKLFTGSLDIAAA